MAVVEMLVPEGTKFDHTTRDEKRPEFRGQCSTSYPDRVCKCGMYTLRWGR